MIFYSSVLGEKNKILITQDWTLIKKRFTTPRVRKLESSIEKTAVYLFSVNENH